MAAFSDAWVVDRTLFDHAALGRCECCGGGIAMMAQSPLLLELCTDLGIIHTNQSYGPTDA